MNLSIGLPDKFGKQVIRTVNQSNGSIMTQLVTQLVTQVIKKDLEGKMQTSPEKWFWV